MRLIYSVASHHIKRSTFIQSYYFRNGLRCFTSKNKKDIFSKTELYDDAVHPKQREGELEAAKWATKNKDKLSKIDKEIKEDSIKDLSYVLDHPIWSPEEVNEVKVTHYKPVLKKDYLAYWAVQTLRFCFDFLSRYNMGKLTPKKVIQRVIFLETIAAVPGMVGAMIRHLHSLRLMKRDYGWIHTLLEEAENERVHLLSTIKLMQPSYFTRLLVLVTQFIFVNAWFITYLISPKFCHRFVGYLEEEAVKTYTHILEKIDDGTLAEFSKTDAPLMAKSYWRLEDNATLKDMFLAIRADEMHHREVNHSLADKNATDPNPWVRRKDIE